MKNRFVLMLLILLAPTILWATTTNRTHIRTLTGDEPANLFVFNTNFLNLRATADAIYNDAGTPLNTNLYLWTNSIHGIFNLIGTGSGIVTGFTEFFVGTIKVSTITAGTGTVAAADIANWNSNFTWYINYYDELAYLPSNNTFSATNTFTTNTYIYRAIRTDDSHVYLEHELVDYDTVESMLTSLQALTLMGSTNKHPVATSDGILQIDTPATWACTNTLAQWTNELGTFLWTNALSANGFIPAGSYMGHFHSYLTADRNTEAWIELIESDGLGNTNVIDVGSRVTLSTDLGSFDTYVVLATNTYGTAGYYLGVRYRANKTVAQAADLITLGGTNYRTHLSTPILSGGFDSTLYIRRDGSQPPSADINWAGYGLTNAHTVEAYTGTFDTVTVGGTNIIDAIESVNTSIIPSVSNWSYYVAKNNLNMNSKDIESFHMISDSDYDIDEYTIRTGRGVIQPYAAGQTMFAHNLYYAGGWKAVIGSGSYGAVVQLNDGDVNFFSSVGVITVTNPSVQMRAQVTKEGTFIVGHYASNRLVVTTNSISATNGASTAGPLALNPSGGNVGIGTNNPAALLHVGTTNNLVVAAGGNVGIGTANPNATLDVNGSIIASNDLTVAGNLIAHGSLAMGYLVCSNNTNEIVWSGPFSRTTTLTNLYWCSSVGAATGTVFTAANATALSAWDSICYTGIACDVTTPSNAPVAIEVTAGQRLGTMVSASTNYTLAVQW